MKRYYLPTMNAILTKAELLAYYRQCTFADGEKITFKAFRNLEIAYSDLFTVKRALENGYIKEANNGQ